MAVEIYKSRRSGYTYYASPTDEFSQSAGNYDFKCVNVLVITELFRAYGWTDNAIAGILGNMESESHMNPGAMEGYVEWTDTGGFGLTQWTPATKYRAWADENNFLPYYDIEYQCERIKYEMTDAAADQYYSTDAYPISRNSFITSDKTPYELACAFAWNYERSWVVLYGTEAEKEALRQRRGSSANKWYEYITGTAAPDIPIPSLKRKGMSKLLLYAAGSDIV